MHMQLFGWIVRCVRAVFAWAVRKTTLLLWAPSAKPDSPNTKPETPDEAYVRVARDRFLASFENTKTDWSENVDPVFRDRAAMSDRLRDPANDLEPEWRRRVLLERTPRGNVIMFYDAFREGFAYYSDQAGISYAIINAVAMKYALAFRCRDFFVDAGSVPPELLSWLAHAIVAEDAAEMDRKRAVVQAMSKPLAGLGFGESKDGALPFAKLKSYRGCAAPADSSLKTQNLTLPDPTPAADAAPQTKNRVIYLGKTRNFSFLRGLPSLTNPKAAKKLSTEGAFAAVFGGAQEGYAAFKARQRAGLSPNPELVA
jgi:hypothetical protein